MTRRRWITAAVISFALLVVLSIYALRSVLWPFIIAFFIAYIFDPWIDFLERRRIPRVASILIVFAVLILILVVSLVLIIPQVSREVSQTAAKIPQYRQVLETRLAPWLRDLRAQHPEIAHPLEDYVNKNWKEKLPLLGAPLLAFLTSMFSGFVNFVVGLLNVFLIPVMAFYMLKDFPQIKQKGLELIPPRNAEIVSRRLSEMDGALGQYLRGQLTVSLALGFMYTVGLLILGVPLAVPVGILSGFANMVPYLGLVLGIGSSMLLSFLDNQDWHRLVWIIVVYTFAQLNEGTWLGPLVVGKRTGLHPVVIMLSLVIGGTLFGFVGMLLAVPFMAAVSVFIKSVYDSYLASEWYQSHRKTEPDSAIVVP